MWRTAEKNNAEDLRGCSQFRTVGGTATELARSLASLQVLIGGSHPRLAVLRQRGRSMPFRWRHNNILLRLQHVVRRHDLHAILVERVLDVCMQCGKGFYPQLLVYQVNDQRVLDIEIRERALHNIGLGRLAYVLGTLGAKEQQ